MKLGDCRYIVVDGPIGVGKTSLARKLAAHLHASLLLENAEANPFLAPYYQDRARFALPTQLFFLTERSEQLRSLSQPQLFSPATVADFLPEKDAIFASATLNEQEHALYTKVSQAIGEPGMTPDLVIFLQAPLEVLLRRVHQRGRSFEHNLEEAYLARIAKAYASFFAYYDRAPVLTVNSAYLDFIRQEDDFSLLLQRIEAMRGQREFFNRSL